MAIGINALDDALLAFPLISVYDTGSISPCISLTAEKHRAFHSMPIKVNIPSITVVTVFLIEKHQKAPALQFAGREPYHHSISSISSSTLTASAFSERFSRRDGCWTFSSAAGFSWSDASLNPLSTDTRNAPSSSK